MFCEDSFLSHPPAHVFFLNYYLLPRFLVVFAFIRYFMLHIRLSAFVGVLSLLGCALAHVSPSSDYSMFHTD